MLVLQQSGGVIVSNVLVRCVVLSGVVVLLSGDRLPAQRGPAAVVVTRVVEREVTSGHSFAKVCSVCTRDSSRVEAE